MRLHRSWKRAAEMQDLLTTCRPAQITHNLAGADSTCHMLTANLPSASVSTTNVWPRVINASRDCILQAVGGTRGVKSWVSLPGVRLSRGLRLPAHGLPPEVRPRPQSRGYPLCDEPRDISAAERISPLSCQMPRGCSGWGFLSSRPSCAVVSARLEGSTRALPTLDS